MELLGLHTLHRIIIQDVIQAMDQLTQLFACIARKLAPAGNRLVGAVLQLCHHHPIGHHHDGHQSQGKGGLARLLRRNVEKERSTKKSEQKSELARL